MIVKRTNVDCADSRWKRLDSRLLASANLHSGVQVDENTLVNFGEPNTNPVNMVRTQMVPSHILVRDSLPNFGNVNEIHFC